MPEIVEAHVEVTCSSTYDMLKSLTSLKRLLLCLASKAPILTGSNFHQLVHLEFCTCETEWDLHMSMLKHSPKLRSLKLNEIHDNVGEFEMCKDWDEPGSVPETLMFVLETFEWRNYRGWKCRIMRSLGVIGQINPKHMLTDLGSYVIRIRDQVNTLTDDAAELIVLARS